MSYNFYQVQMSNGWVERLNKEKKLADKFWYDRAKQEMEDDGASTIACTDVTARSATTVYLRNKVEQLESKLEVERMARRKLQQDIVEATCRPVQPGQLRSTDQDNKQP